MDFKSHLGEVEIKATTGQKGIIATVAGYFAAFGNVDSDGDIILPGAFAKTIKERGPEGSNQIFHLLQHDAWSVLGKPTVLKEDTFGLYFETPMPDTTIARDTVKLYEAGIYNEHSIGYRVISNSEAIDADGQTVRYLQELKLWEGSTVTWGANPMTPFVGMKSENSKDVMDEIAKRLEKINKAITDNHFSEKTMNLLQIEIGVITEAIKQMRQSPTDDVTIQEPYDPISFLKAYDLGYNILNHFNFE
jgi:HK97 family phage prohead protease